MKKNEKKKQHTWGWEEKGMIDFDPEGKREEKRKRKEKKRKERETWL
jgi:hypothetical protein